MAPTGPSIPPAAEDEIDLRQLAASLRRRWRLIAQVAGGTLLLSGLYAVLSRPVWEGEFQIVLATDKGGSGGLAKLAAANPMLAGLAGLGGGTGKDSLETEVKVLESPSVLNISYTDTDRQLVLPVIERISSAYQSYSGRAKRRESANAVAFLSQSVDRLAPRAEASMRRAQAFALENGLGLSDGMAASSGAATTTGGGSGGEGPVEASRQQAQARVLLLEQRLAQALASRDTVVYQAPQLQANAGLYAQYQGVEADLSDLRSRLRDSDDLVRNLERQRRNLISTLNRQTIGLLKGELATARATLQASSRPNAVVLRHRELVRQAVRDERILLELENQLQLAQLEQAKQNDPWELISTPTLLDRPVAPRKGRILALGLLAGLVLGSGAALVAERRSGRVFADDELEQLLPGPLLARLDNPPDPATLALLAQGPLAGCRRLALIPVGVDAASAAAVHGPLLAAVRELCPEADVICSRDLLACRGADQQLLLASPGAATRAQLEALREELRLQGGAVCGWLLLPQAAADG